MSGSELPTRNGYGTIEIRCPFQLGLRPAYVSLAFIKEISARGPGKAREFAEIVVPALKTPVAIFQGLRWDHPEIDEDDWFCYVAKPQFAYDYKRHQRRSAWADQVLTIFVTSEWVVYNWCWTKCAPEDSKLPIDFQTRFANRKL